MPAPFGRLSRASGRLGRVFPLAVLCTWPLARHFSTHCIGPIGDARFWMWDIWQFRHNLTGSNPHIFRTDMVYWPYGADLVLQHGVFYNALGFFLQPRLGLVATYNLCLLSALALAGWGVFLIALEWGAGWGAAFTAGAIFAFSPDATGLLRGGMGLDFMSRQVLAFFVWALWRAARRRRGLDAALAALAWTWAWSCNYYFFLFCSLLIPLFFLILEKPFELSAVKRKPSPGLSLTSRALDAALLIDALWLARALRAGQMEFHGRGGLKALLAYTAPYLFFWVLAALRLAASVSFRARLRREAFGLKALFPYAATLGFYAAINLPLVAYVVRLAAGQGYSGPAHSWRGGGNPTDAWLLLQPSPWHPLWGAWARARFGQDGTECLGLLPLLGAAWLWRRRPRDSSVRLWFAGAAFSLLMTLGPWLKLFGVHTYLPLPFYFVHLLPVFSGMQTGYRFAACIALFTALLCAAALMELERKFGRRATALAFAALAFEFACVEVPLTRPEVPAILQRLAARPDGAMLPVPMGALFDGIAANGCIGRLPDMYWQTGHRKPIVGGAIGRMPRRVYESMSADPFLAALVSAQSGGAIPASLRDRAFVARYFRDARLLYVLVDAGKTPEALRRAVAGWPLRLLDEDRPAGLRLYAFDPPAS